MTNEVAAWLVVVFFGGMLLNHTLWVVGVLHPRRKLLERLREHEIRMDRERSAFYAELDERVEDRRILRDLVALHRGTGTAVTSWDEAFERAEAALGCSEVRG